MHKLLTTLVLVLIGTYSLYAQDYGVRVTAQKTNAKIIKAFETWHQMMADKELEDFGVDFSDWTLIEESSDHVAIRVRGGIDIKLDDGSLFKYIIIGRNQEKIELDFEF